MIVPLTQDHVLALYGKPLPRTLRGFAVVEDGKVLGLIGCYPAVNAMAVAMRITPELRNRPKTVVKLAKRMMSLPGNYVVAKCDESIEAAGRFLKHFGFDEQENGIWTLQR